MFQRARFLVWGIGLWMWAMPAWCADEAPAAGAPSGSTQATSAAPAPSPSKILGLLDTRPSWTSLRGEMHTENVVELGYQFNPDLKLTYVQCFNTNLYNPSSANSGLGLVSTDSYLRFRRYNLWVSEDQKTNLAYQARAYVPTVPYLIDAGFKTALRNYLRVTRVLSDVVSTDLTYAATVMAFDRAGNKSTANPWFEHRFIANADIRITQKLTFSLPLVWQITKFRDFAPGAAYNNQWQHFVWTWPEFDYALTDVHTIGLAYYSDNLVKPDFSGLSIEDGLKKGVTQLLWIVSI